MLVVRPALSPLCSRLRRRRCKIRPLGFLDPSVILARQPRAFPVYSKFLSAFSGYSFLLRSRLEKERVLVQRYTSFLRGVAADLLEFWTRSEAMSGGARPRFAESLRPLRCRLFDQPHASTCRRRQHGEPLKGSFSVVSSSHVNIRHHNMIICHHHHLMYLAEKNQK